MIENLKKLCAEMDNKGDFVREISIIHKKDYDYISRKWFQKNWNIPDKILAEIVTSAQNWLYIQVQRKRNLLEATGYTKAC